MPITAKQTTNLNPEEQPVSSSPSQIISSGAPGYIGGGTTQSQDYSVKSGEPTRSGMFTNLQDYLKANEGAAAPIVGKFEEKAKSVVDPFTKSRTELQSSLGGLKSSLETSKAGLESTLGKQKSLQDILSTARNTPTGLTKEQISQFRTGIESYKTPDVQSQISTFAPQKQELFNKQADVLSSAQKAKSTLQPLGEITGVKGNIRALNPDQVVTAGGSSLDAFITRQSPQYQEFEKSLRGNLSDVAKTEGMLTPYSKAIQDYLGSGEGSLSNIGSKFDPNFASGSQFQTGAESLLSSTLPATAKTEGYNPSGIDQLAKDIASGAGTYVTGYDKAGQPIYADLSAPVKGGVYGQTGILENAIRNKIQTDFQYNNILTPEQKTAYENRARLAGLSDAQIATNLKASQLTPQQMNDLTAKILEQYRGTITGGESPASPVTAPIIPISNDTNAMNAFVPTQNSDLATALTAATTAPDINLAQMLAPSNAVTSYISNLGNVFKR